MSEIELPFGDKGDFDNEAFYYFLPSFNSEQKKKIGEKITKFKGKISFSLKENINILINKTNDILTQKFKQEILFNGNIHFYDGEKVYFLKCLNKKISKPNNYKCVLVDVFMSIVRKFDENEELISYFIKLGLKDNINLSSSILYHFPSIDNQKYKCYEFPKIEEAIFQEKSLTKYEIPQYIGDIPEGFSCFCTLWEASKVKQYIQLSPEQQDHLGNDEKEDKNSGDVLKEPIPKTNFCHLCRRKFDNYLVHIETEIHKNNICKNPMTINTAKDTFKRINQFWEDKKNSNNNNNVNNKAIKKSESNKFSGTSMSSFSSAISTYKFDDNLIKDINNFVLEQDNSDIEKNSNKENQSENKNNNQTKKIRHTKNKSYFVTPSSKENLLESKYSSHLSSSQSSLNLFINKKRKVKNERSNNNLIEEENEEKQKDYFPQLNMNKTKKLIRGVDIFFK